MSQFRRTCMGLVSWVSITGCGSLDLVGLLSDEASSSGVGDESADDASSSTDTSSSTPLEPNAASGELTESQGPIQDTTDPSPAEPPRFGDPQLVEALSDPDHSDNDPSLTADLLEVVFASRRPGGAGSQDLWTSTRASLDAEWAPPTPLTIANDEQLQSRPVMSGDGLLLTFSSDISAGNADLFYMTRTSRDAAWEAPVAFVELNTDRDDLSATLSANQLTVYVCSVADAQSDLWRATRANPNDPFGARIRLDWASTENRECSISFMRDERLFVFTSNRPGSAQFDLYWGDLESQTVERIEELASPFAERHPWISPDGDTIYYSRKEGESYSIYRAPRLQ